MRRFFRSIRTNILYGTVFLVPVAAFVLVAYYIFGVWKEILLPFSNQLGLSTIESRALAVVMAIVALLAICFIIGFFIRTRLGAWTFEHLEKRLFSQLPGYNIIASMLRGFADEKSAYPPALVTLFPNGPAVLGFVVEETNGPNLTIYVPNTPMITIGQVYLVDRQNVKFLKGTTMEAANCMSQWGIGLDEFLRKGKEDPRQIAE